MSFYIELQRATEADQAALQAIPIIDAALNGQVTRNQYVAYLTQAYHHVKHTVPLLMACGARLGGEQEWLRTAIAHYIEEEVGHQEWILNDIRTCGGDGEAVRHGEPSPATELMVSYAYDTIARVNPVGFFGMVYVLEGTSTQLATRAAATLQSALGLPQEAFRYLASHGALDLAHMKFFSDLVNRLESAADRQCIIHRAKMFFRLYGDIFRSLPEVTA
jgi:pyrroloquinoline quinone (PQQ) biosynthesis protein C